jgi:hypothetical protein
MNYDYEDCFDEVKDIEKYTKIEIDYKVFNDIEQKKRKIRNKNKKLNINKQILNKIENKE